MNVCRYTYFLDSKAWDRFLPLLRQNEMNWRRQRKEEGGKEEEQEE